MCVILDANCIPIIFNKNNSEHYRFIDVLKWITKGSGSIVYGGKKYKKELKALRKYIPIFNELDKQGRLIKLPDNEVDEIAQEVSEIIDRDDFDDEHLVAIVRVSGCLVICTDDQRAEPYLKCKELYPRGVRKPKIYKSASHKALCCDNNIVGICRERIEERR